MFWNLIFWKKIILISALISTALLIAWAISLSSLTGFLAIVGALCGIILVGVGIRYPQIPFYILVASFALGNILKTEMLATTFLVIPGGIALFCLLIHVIMFHQPFLLSWNVFWPWLFFLIWAFVITLAYESLGDFRPYFLVVILFILTLNVLRTTNHLKSLAWVVVLSLTFSSCMVIWDRIVLILKQGLSIDPVILHSSFLVLGDKNIVSMQILCALPFAFALLSIHQSRKKRVLLFLAVFMNLLAIFLLVSMGALIGLLVILVGAFVLEKKPRRRTAMIILFLIMVIAVIFSPFQERIQQQTDILSQGNPSNWLTYRGMIWIASLKMISSNPFWGYGSYFNINREYMRSSYIENWLKIYVGSSEKLLQAHNTFLTILTQFGIPGFIFFVLGLLVAGRLLWRVLHYLQRKPEKWLLYFTRALAIALAAILVQAMALTVPVDKQLWVMLGTVPALGRIALLNKNNDIDQQSLPGA